MASNAYVSVVAFFVVALVPSSEQTVKITPSANYLLVKKGASQVLTCATASFQSSLLWDFPQKEKSGVNVKTNVESGKGQTSTLEIGNFTSDRLGDYTCKHTIGKEEYTSTIFLIPVEEEKVEPTYNFNTTAKLSCTLKLPPSPLNNAFLADNTLESVKWMKGDKAVSSLPERVLNRYSKPLDTDSLVIENPEPEDTGMYTAVIKLSAYSLPYKCDVAFKEAVVKIKETKVEPMFQEGNKRAVLSCNINSGGRDISGVEWFQNNTLVSELKEHNRFEVQPENNSLIIKDTIRDDAGLYIARFTVVGMPEPYDCKVMYKAAPYVTPFKKSKNLIEKDNLELQCDVKGYPRAVVTWLKDGKVLNTSTGEGSRIKLQPLNGYKNAHLILKDITFDDAGEYRCLATSEIFNQSFYKDITVRVKDKLAALWPFLGIVCEVIILCAIIFIYERRRNKQAEQEENNAQEAYSKDTKEGLRHRNQKK